MSITVDGGRGQSPPDQSQWHLPTYDPHNENKYHYKLHSLDIYFWTHTDALQFVNGVRRVLPPAQVEVLDEPGPPSHAPPSTGRAVSQDVNPLVQKLERAAISESNSRGTPPSGTHQQQGGLGVPSFDPPPISAVHGAEESPASYAPIAYNPAAPAAPEQVRHREKTPPPMGDDGIDPLRAAVAVDQAPPYTPGYGPLSPGFPGGPAGHYPGVASPGFPPSSPFGHLQRSATMPVTGGLASPGLVSPYGAGPAYPGSPGFASPAPPPPPPPNTHSHPTPPPAATQTPLQSPGLAPPGGFSNYNYSNPLGGGIPQGGNEYAVHQQAYRPTDYEHSVKYKPKTEGRSKLGENADRFERGVTGMLKKFEKKFNA